MGRRNALMPRLSPPPRLSLPHSLSFRHSVIFVFPLSGHGACQWLPLRRQAEGLKDFTISTDGTD